MNNTYKFLLISCAFLNSGLCDFHKNILASTEYEITSNKNVVEQYSFEDYMNENGFGLNMFGITDSIAEINRKRYFCMMKAISYVETRHQAIRGGKRKMFHGYHQLSKIFIKQANFNKSKFSKDYIESSKFTISSAYDYIESSEVIYWTNYQCIQNKVKKDRLFDKKLISSIIYTHNKSVGYKNKVLHHYNLLLKTYDYKRDLFFEKQDQSVLEN